jgi:hypothetical protein
MEYINKNRIDAHAKGITTDALNQLLIAMDWIDERVNDYLS